MGDDRRVALARTGRLSFRATNGRGGTLDFGSGHQGEFTPVELLLTAIAGCTGIAGSATIGAHCMIGGGVGINGHVTIADGVVLTGATQVSRSIAKTGVYSGVFPFDDNAAWEKNAATLRNLHALRERVKALEKKTP
jgi:acyl-[acyl carrier protein]--UDP-N-acetylglucosamine O-acyltransferase